MYKTVVEKINMTSDEIVNDYHYWSDKSEYYDSLSGKFVRLKLVNQVDTPFLNLENLIKNGLNAAPQSSIKIYNQNLISYIDKYLDDNYYLDTFPDSDDTKSCIEGAKVTVQVNKFERSSNARQRCI